MSRIEPRSGERFFRRYAAYARGQRFTTAFSRSYTLTPLRGCSGSTRFPWERKTTQGKEWQRELPRLFAWSFLDSAQNSVQNVRDRGFWSFLVVALVFSRRPLLFGRFRLLTT